MSLYEQLKAIIRELPGVLHGRVRTYLGRAEQILAGNK